MNTCKVCHREFFGNYTFQVVEIDDSGICSRCALLAVNAIDSIEMHATDLENGWIGIPKVEWLAVLEEYKSAQFQPPELDMVTWPWQPTSEQVQPSSDKQP